MTATRKRQRILAIKLADLGDVLLCEPAFRSLRMAFPSAQIDVLTTPASAKLLDLIGHDLNAVVFPKSIYDRPAAFVNPRPLVVAARLALRLRSARYDRVVVMHHLTTAFGARKFAMLVAATGCRYVAGLDNGRGTFLTHRVDDLGFGQRHESQYMRDVAIAAGGAEVEAVPRITPLVTGEPVVQLPASYAVLFPATGPFSRAREWPVDRFEELARSLNTRGITPVIVGGDDAQLQSQRIMSAEPAAIDLVGKTSLVQLATVVSRAKIAIGGDSFVGHLAASIGTPVVSMFGPSNANAWRPRGAKDADDDHHRVGDSIVVRHAMPCQPCMYTGFRLGRPDGCTDRTCLKRIATADVEIAVSRVLGAI